MAVRLAAMDTHVDRVVDKKPIDSAPHLGVVLGSPDKKMEFS